VWSLRVNGQLAVGRVGQRGAADLGWETELMLHLSSNGMSVPLPIPTTDGALFADGLVVMTYVEGVSPQTAEDWSRVAGALRQLHELTRDWPQRPGWKSSTDLLTDNSGSVVHGDPNPRNIRITAERVGFIDWDEAHVDVSDLDLNLPHNVANHSPDMQDIVGQASAAWEAAVCWRDAHAEEQLALVRPV
jgi:Ser/Thr protein kinase RdoA (MazF antagonist)